MCNSFETQDEWWKLIHDTGEIIKNVQRYFRPVLKMWNTWGDILTCMVDLWDMNPHNDGKDFKKKYCEETRTFFIEAYKQRTRKDHGILTLCTAKCRAIVWAGWKNNEILTLEERIVKMSMRWQSWLVWSEKKTFLKDWKTIDFLLRE